MTRRRTDGRRAMLEVVMFRSTLVAQLLTFVLDTQGADAVSVMELFPEEFAPRVQHSEGPARAGAHWPGASADLEDSLTYLVERGLVRIDVQGRVTPRDERFSPDEYDEGFADARPYDAREWGRADSAFACEFDEPRLEG